VVAFLRYNVFGTTNLLSRKEVNHMSLFSNFSQLYFDFVYHQYLNEHSEFKYLHDLINVIDWSVVPAFNHKYGRLGYSNQSILKALFVQKVKGFKAHALSFSMYPFSLRYLLITSMTRIMLPLC